MSETLAEFQELDGWGEELTRFAEEAADVTDDRELREAALTLLLAVKRFEAQLDRVDVELG